MKLEIEKLGYLGDGVAPGPVIVRRALPGELVEGEVKKGILAAPRILVASPERVRPPCPKFHLCGGCVLQHGSDTLVAGWKRGLVVHALGVQGITAEVLPTVASPPNSRRRAAISARRTRKGVCLGFHGRASGMIVPIEKCTVLHPDLLAALPALEQIARIGASRKCEIRFTITRTLSGVDVLTEGGKPLDPALREMLAEMVMEHGLARLIWGNEPIATLSPPRVRFGRADVELPPGAFLQATEHGEKTLVSAVSEAVSDARCIADLFAGCGTFALSLAERAKVHAVEGCAEMLGALESAWRVSAGMKRVTVEHRDLFRNPVPAEDLAGFDAVVVDPPRAGAEAQIHEIAKAHVRVVALVSCNPVTFARDARILKAAGYRIGPVLVVDQFRWSAHVEIFARFTLA